MWKNNGISKSLFLHAKQSRYHIETTEFISKTLLSLFLKMLYIFILFFHLKYLEFQSFFISDLLVYIKQYILKIDNNYKFRSCNINESREEYFCKNLFNILISFYSILK